MLDESRWPSFWPLLLHARATRGDQGKACSLAPDPGCGVRLLAYDDPRGVLRRQDRGPWTLGTAPAQQSWGRDLRLYLPWCNVSAAQPLTLAHLGQSLDGRIATLNGCSQFLTGTENLQHIHRIRALADAVLVGAETIRCDDPQLTTRRVPGGNPVRVILSGSGELPTDRQVFRDQAAPTLVFAPTGANPASPCPQVQWLPLATRDGRPDLRAVLQCLRARGMQGIFIEGGGTTVSAFLQAGLLDHLQITVAPVLLGSGRPGICLPDIRSLDEALRPSVQSFRMGPDVMFDCDCRSGHQASTSE